MNSIDEINLIRSSVAYPILRAISNKIMGQLSIDGVIKKDWCIYPGELVICTLQPKYRFHSSERFRAYLFDRLEEFNAILSKIAGFEFNKIGTPTNKSSIVLDSFANANPIFGSKYGQTSLYKAVHIWQTSLYALKAVHELPF